MNKQKAQLALSPTEEMDEDRAESANTHAQTKTKSGTEQRKFDRQITMTEVKGSALGSKQASLYLSRNVSLIRTGTRESQRNFKINEDVNDISDCKSEGSSKATSIQREFTFTGYDIMADGKNDFLVSTHKSVYFNIKLC